MTSRNIGRQTVGNISAKAMEKAGGESPEQPSSDTVAIMAAISNCQNVFTAKFDHLQEQLNFFKHDMDKMKDRASEVERRVGEVEDTSGSNSEQISILRTQMKTLLERVDDAENRNRRNNIQILGIPEKEEGGNPVQFAEKLIKEVLASISLSPFFLVERAHRIPTRPLPPGAPTRPFIIRVLNFRDRDLILAEARKKKEIPYANTKLLFFPDFSAEVQKSRRSFNAVRACLTIFPAKLRVEDGERVCIFTSPEEASEWIDALQPR